LLSNSLTARVATLTADTLQGVILSGATTSGRPGPATLWVRRPLVFQKSPVQSRQTMRMGRQSVPASGHLAIGRFVRPAGPR
jgi:hypothetical protein